MNEPALAVSVPRTLRLKVRREAYPWLNAAAIEVNTVWNWANEISAKAARPFAGQPHWLTGFDLNNLSAGATEYFSHIGADTIQRVNGEWRVSRASRRSLGWVPFKAASLKRQGNAVRFCGKTFRVFEAARLEGDINAARNILTAGLRCRASVRGNELLYLLVAPSLAYRVCEAGTEPARAAA